MQVAALTTFLDWQLWCDRRPFEAHSDGAAVDDEVAVRVVNLRLGYAVGAVVPHVRHRAARQVTLQHRRFQIHVHMRVCTVHVDT